MGWARFTRKNSSATSSGAGGELPGVADDELIIGIRQARQLSDGADGIRIRPDYRAFVEQAAGHQAPPEPQFSRFRSVPLTSRVPFT